MGQRPSGASDFLDAPWACASDTGSSVHQAWKAVRVSGFCPLTTAAAIDGSVTHCCLSVVEHTVYAWNEPVADLDRGVRHHALAIRLHWFGDQAIFLRTARRLPGHHRGKDTPVASTRDLRDGMRAGDLVKVHWSCFRPGN